MSTKLSFFAEVVESSPQSWKSQCWQWDQPPIFGSLVVVDCQKNLSYGVVHHIYTGSDDPSRSVFAYQKTLEELQREQPQVFMFLKTVFTALTVGYTQDQRICYTYAPLAASLHAFVRPATAEEYQLFFKRPDYLPILFGQAHQLGNLDELLLAMIRVARQHGGLDEGGLQQFIETFSLLGNNDYRRLKMFLQRVEQVV